MSTALAACPSGGRTLLDQEFRPAGPQLVREIRKSVRGCLGREVSVPDESADDVLVVVSELVTNSLLHATGSPIRLTLTLLEDLRILSGSVHDCGAVAFELPGSDVPAGAENGRGLLVVAALTSHCWIEPSRYGKAVRFALALPECRSDDLP
ncbi:ATP-binding protein [Yinghuangia soli]|uniref:ATP-binding protein n=1 Tax=Yinghuangia soli TaxID=2908204 RepID=A0AA41Q5W5_9ACTN|nr:ATP-binding protein [Yinghuangia soli]MCF2532133.1 ATP-binding protein [Yinghuangia soli]